jgi:hypothetical protein
MQSANLSFSIVNAVLFGRRTICCFEAKLHIFLHHGVDTPFPSRSYTYGISPELPQSGTPEIRWGNQVLRIPLSNTPQKQKMTGILGEACHRHTVAKQ